MIYVGYDDNYQRQYDVCVASIKKHKEIPIEKTPNSLITRSQDGATQFTYSRFLIPYISNFEGWAVFCDSDFIFIEDPTELFEFIDETKAVSVVQHDPYVVSGVKMNGKPNVYYPRKNWSSLILWNCAHADNRILTPEYINRAIPANLHRFQWLSDDKIGSLPKEWNVLIGHHSTKAARALHFTNGTNTEEFDYWARKIL